jgi:hypothetical protein
MDPEARVGLALFIMGGIVVSYLPQFVNIATSRSVEGISTLFLLLGYIGASSTLTTVIIQTISSRKGLKLDLLALIQVLIQFICFNVYMTLFIYYSPHKNIYLIIIICIWLTAIVSASLLLPIEILDLFGKAVTISFTKVRSFVCVYRNDPIHASITPHHYRNEIRIVEHSDFVDAG